MGALLTFFLYVWGFSTIASNSDLFSPYFEFLYWSKNLSTIPILILTLIKGEFVFSKTAFSFFYPLILFILYDVINGLLRGDLIYIIQRSSGMIIIFLLLVSKYDLKKKINSLVGFMFVSIVLISIAHYYFSFDFSYNSSATLSNEYQVRTTLGFNHPGVLAQQILLFSIIYLVSQKNRVYNSLIILSTLVFLYTTYAQNALFSFIIFILFKNGRNLFIKLLALASSALILIFSLGYQNLDILSSGRLGLWLTHINLNLDGSLITSIFGTAPGRAIRIDYDSLFFSSVGISEKFHIDNFYIETLIENGLLGLLLILFLIINIFFRVPNELRTFNFGLLFMICFYSFFDSSFLSVGSVAGFIYWLLLKHHLVKLT